MSDDAHEFVAPAPVRAGKAIVLTATGAAAVAVIRLCGAGLGPFLQTHFSRPVRPGRCVYGRIVDAQRVVDDAVAVLHEGGSTLDLSIHGGPWVVRSVLELARREGFDLVPGSTAPLPAEACDGTSALEVEMLQWLPAARTELALRTLLAQPQAWAALRDAIRRGRTSPRVLADIAADRSLHWLLNPPRIAIIGPPNVGKSTLANQLFAQERSITADVPGTTRDWVGEIADIDGLAAMLVDTPGLRTTEDAIEQEAIARGREQIAAADLVVLVLDAARALGGQEYQMLQAHADAIVVVNRCDLAVDGGADVPGALRTIATRGQGVDRLRSLIRERFGCESIDPAQPRCWTARQRRILQRADTRSAALDELWTGG